MRTKTNRKDNYILVAHRECTNVRSDLPNTEARAQESNIFGHRHSLISEKQNHEFSIQKYEYNYPRKAKEKKKEKMFMFFALTK